MFSIKNVIPVTRWYICHQEIANLFWFVAYENSYVHIQLFSPILELNAGLCSHNWFVRGFEGDISRGFDTVNILILRESQLGVLIYLLEEA